MLICHFVSVHRPVDTSVQGVIVFCSNKGAIEKNDLFYGINQSFIKTYAKTQLKGFINIFMVIVYDSFTKKKITESTNFTKKARISKELPLLYICLQKINI